MPDRHITLPSCPRYKAFTLVELLVVVAIVGALAGLLLPAIGASREAARRAQCVSNLRQLALAVANYESAHGAFPPGVRQQRFPGAVAYRGTPLFAFLLPYLEARQLLTSWDYDQPLNNPSRGAPPITAVVLPALVCPSDELSINPVTVPGRNWVYALTSYGGNGGTRSYFPDKAAVDGIFHATGEASEPAPHQQPVTVREVSDGLAQTLLLGERSHWDANYEQFNAAGWGEALAAWGWWGASTSRKMIGHVTLGALAPVNFRVPFGYDASGPNPPAGAPGDFQHYVDQRLSAYGSEHAPGGAGVAYADGSVHYLSADTDHQILRQLSTRAGGNAD